MKTGWADDEYERGEQYRQHHVDVRQPLNAPRHTGNGRQHERDGEDRDDDDEHRVAGLADAGDDVQPAADLQRAEPERGRRTEQRGEDRQHVDDLAARPVCAVAKQRLEGGADQLHPALPVDAVGDGEPDHRVDRPRVQRPVEQRGGHRGLHRFGITWRTRARRRCREVGERLGDTEEHQADAHAGAEHHRHPGNGPELGLLVVAAERDAAELAERQPQHEHHEPGSGQREQPAHVVHDPAQCGPRCAGQRFGADETPHQEPEGDDGGDTENHLVEPAVAGVQFVVDRHREDRVRLGLPVRGGRRRGDGVLRSLRRFTS